MSIMTQYYILTIMTQYAGPRKAKITPSFAGRKQLRIEKTHFYKCNHQLKTTDKQFKYTQPF